MFMYLTNSNLLRITKGPEMLNVVTLLAFTRLQSGQAPYSGRTLRPSAHWVHTTWIDKVSPSPLPHLITDPSLAHRGIHVTSQIESMRFVRHSCRFMSCGLSVHAALEHLASNIRPSQVTLNRVSVLLRIVEKCQKQTFTTNARNV